jgi:hypothetical protein
MVVILPWLLGKAFSCFLFLGEFSHSDDKRHHVWIVQRVLYIYIYIYSFFKSRHLEFMRSLEQSGILKKIYFPAWRQARFVSFLLTWSPVHLLDKIETENGCNLSLIRCSQKLLTGDICRLPGQGKSLVHTEWNTWSIVSISRLASDLLGRGGFVGFPQLPDAGEITWLVFLRYKKDQNRSFRVRFLLGP